MEYAASSGKQGIVFEIQESRSDSHVLSHLYLPPPPSLVTPSPPLPLPYLLVLPLPPPSSTRHSRPHDVILSMCRWACLIAAPS